MNSLTSRQCALRNGLVPACACLTLIVAGCATLKGDSPRYASRAPANYVSAPRLRPTMPARPRLVSLEDDQANVPPKQRIVVYSAGYRITVPDVEEAIREAERIAEAFGGYVQLVHGNAITIRVPAPSHPEAVQRVEALGNVTFRKQEAIDVTEQYVDLEARLRNATAVRKRLEALLARAEDVTAAIAVEKELNRVGEEIERLEAKLELLKNKVALSSITATFEYVGRNMAALNSATRLPFAWLRGLDPNRLLQTR